MNYEKGWCGGTQNLERAFYYKHAAATQGYVKAMVDMAQYYMEGTGLYKIH